MKYKIPKPTPISAIRSRQCARADIRGLEIRAIGLYGDRYWEVPEFHCSSTARALEFSTAEVNYYTHQFHKSINYN